MQEEVGLLTDSKAEKLSLEELRRLALQITSRSVLKKSVHINTYNRSKAVRNYVLKRAEGKCEGCNDNAPFQTKLNKPYLEPHHTTRVADGGPDHPVHVIALCPTCHARVHHSVDGNAYNNQLIERMSIIETKSVLA